MSIEEAFIGNLKDIKEFVIISPVFYPNRFGLKGNKTAIGNIVANGELTFIKTYPGQPWTSDTVLALRKTKAKKIIFLGSAGSLNKKHKIGDVVVFDRPDPKRVGSVKSFFDCSGPIELIDLEAESFFAACKKINKTGTAVLIVQDLPKIKPFYKPFSKIDRKKLDAGITRAIEICKTLAKNQ